MQSKGLSCYRYLVILHYILLVTLLIASVQSSIFDTSSGKSCQSNSFESQELENIWSKNISLSCWHLFEILPIKLCFYLLRNMWSLSNCKDTIGCEITIFYVSWIIMGPLYCRLSRRNTLRCSGRKWETRNWSSGKQDLWFIFSGYNNFFKMCPEGFKSADTSIISILKMTVQVPSIRELLCFCRYFGIL